MKTFKNLEELKAWDRQFVDKMLAEGRSIFDYALISEKDYYAAMEADGYDVKATKETFGRGIFNN